MGRNPGTVWCRDSGEACPRSNYLNDSKGDRA
jgi:hypothetical protein